jgi:hypothetical protein
MIISRIKLVKSVQERERGGYKAIYYAIYKPSVCDVASCQHDTENYGSVNVKRFIALRIICKHTRTLDP